MKLADAFRELNSIIESVEQSSYTPERGLKAVLSLKKRAAEARLWSFNPPVALTDYEKIRQQYIDANTYSSSSTYESSEEEEPSY